jgi:glycosyltransferase involved in cell wall biosynthesis
MPETIQKSDRTLVIFSPLLHHDENMKVFGGIHPWVINFTNGLSRLGYQVTLIVSTRQANPAIPGLENGVQIHKVGFHSISALWGLYQYYRTHSVGITLTAGHRYNRLVEKVSRFCKTGKWIVSIHENMSKSIASMHPEKGRKREKEIQHYTRADGIITVSEGLKTDLVENYKFPPELMKVIYNPLVKREDQQLAQEPVAHPWFQDGVNNIILGVGRLENQKNWPLLISAFARFVEKYDARLVILGEGKNRAELEKQIVDLKLEDKVQLPGFVSNPYAYFARCRYLALSSDWEGFGNVLVEAMSVGTPVISTDCPSGPSEILQNGKWGELVPPGDEEQLLRGLEKTWLNPLDKKLLQSRAQDFTVDRQVQEMDSYLTNL